LHILTQYFEIFLLIEKLFADFLLTLIVLRITIHFQLNLYPLVEDSLFVNDGEKKGRFRQAFSVNLFS